MLKLHFIIGVTVNAPFFMSEWGQVNSSGFLNTLIIMLVINVRERSCI